jgi:hypothetical protein
MYLWKAIHAGAFWLLDFKCQGLRKSHRVRPLTFEIEKLGNIIYA